MSNLAERALAKLDTEGMFAFLRDLVRTPSVFLPGVPGANEQRAADLVFDLLESVTTEPPFDEPCRMRERDAEIRERCLVVSGIVRPRR